MKEEKKYVVSLDQGTTSCRSLLINKQGKIVDFTQFEINQYYPQEGWVEHDAVQIWHQQKITFLSLMSKRDVSPEEIVAVGITNQRETVVVWNKKTGLPIYRAIVWQDTRTKDYCQTLAKTEWKDKIHQKTGLFVNPYFSATKLKWILENVPVAKELLKKNDLLAGTIDSWLIWCLTGGKKHVTDVTNASRTMLFNIKTLTWDNELLDLFQVPKSILPQVISNDELIGHVEARFFGEKYKGSTPVIGSAIGDQQSSLFGQLCFQRGSIKNTYGTGAFLIVNTGKEVILSKHGLLSTIAFRFKDQVTYALEGSVFIAGSVIKYLRDGLRLIYHEYESEMYASLAQRQERKNVYFVPAFTGLGAPHWDSTARGAIFGLSQDVLREHIVKAALESIAYQTNDIVEVIQSELKTVLREMNVDGGAAVNNYLLQFQSNISNVKVIRPFNVETTALGAAYIAGLNVNFWKNRNELVNFKKVEREFTPNLQSEQRRELVAGWKDAVRRTMGWTK